MAMSSAAGPTGGFVMQGKKGPSDGVMVAFRLPAAIGQTLLDLASGLPGLMPLDELHVTLAYLGDASQQTGPDEEALKAELEQFAQGWGPISGSINGIGRFVDNPDQDCLYANFDSPDLPGFRAALVDFLKSADCQVAETHGYTPHITLAYIPKDLPTPTIGLNPIDVTFDSLWEAYGDRGDYTIPFAAKSKASKADAQYTDQASNPNERCAMCQHFIETATCQVVQGRISPDGWCKFFEIKGGAVPYKVVKRKNGKWFVKGPDGSLKPQSGYDTRGEAVNYQRALYAHEGQKSGLPAPKQPEHLTSTDSSGIFSEAAPDPNVSIEDVQDDASKAKNPDMFAYVPDKDSPSTWKLDISDAQHVILAAAALGPNPPHGHGADIPDKDKGKVKSKIRGRARELKLPKEDMAKVNAYLSGRMPAEKMSASEQNAWTDTFDQALEQTGDENKAACAAQGVLNRRAVLGLKADGTALPTKVEGWAVLFTDPDELDLQGTYFDDMTRLLTEYYPRAPLWMEHGKDPEYGADPIGFRSVCQVFPIGVWLEHDLHLTHPLYARTAKDAADGVFSYSSDSLAHYAQQGYDPRDGHLGEWPLAGCSLTRTPAEPGLGPVKAKSLELALKSAVLQREAADGAPGQEQSNEQPVVAPIKKEENMDETTAATRAEEAEDKQKEQPEVDEAKKDTEAKLEEEAAKDGLVGVNDDNDNFDTPDDGEPDADDIPATTLEALAQMYGCENEPDAVRAHMDRHIAEMHKAGVVHPELLKAMGLPEGTEPKAVEDHLNNLYSAAMSKKEVAPPSPAPTMSLNYGALHRHLHSGGAATRSQGPYMTGEIAAKGINPLSGITKTPIMGLWADLIRKRNGDRPKYVLGQKAMTSATGPTGGYILHQEIAPTVLDPLRAKAVCFQLGATEINMQGTNVMTVPIMNSAPDAAWAGENQAITDTQPAYRTVTLYPHGIYDLVKVPYNVEANMTPQAESQLREQMAKSIALKLDKAAMLGTGGALSATGGMEIIGILNTPAAQTYDMGGNGRTPSFIDIGQAFGLLDDQNVPDEAGSKRGVALHSQLSRAFTLATDALGNPLLRPAWRNAAERELLAMPYAISTQIPTNVTYGTATNSSYIFGGDWIYMYIGLSDQVEVRLDQTFAGNLQAGLLIYMYADVKIVYPQAFFVMKGVLPVSISGVTTSTNAIS